MSILKKNLILHFKTSNVAYQAASYIRGLGIKFQQPVEERGLFVIKVTLESKIDAKLEFIYLRFDEWGFPYRATILGEVVKEQRW